MTSGSGGTESVARQTPAAAAAGGGGGELNGRHGAERCGYFQMPLHYPRYTKADYESMPEWKLNCLLQQYGLPVAGNVDQKRQFAMGAFLWSH